jgi:4-oxalocrotonate tautomerase
MPIMQVFIMEGRSQDQKEKLIEALTQAAMTSIDAPRESVRVLLTEVPKDHWGIGGQTATALGR